jgi:hypothetical protein
MLLMSAYGPKQTLQDRRSMSVLLGDVRCSQSAVSAVAIVLARLRHFTRLGDAANFLLGCSDFNWLLSLFWAHPFNVRGRRFWQKSPLGGIIA